MCIDSRYPPFTPAQANQKLRFILREGEVIFSKHALDAATDAKVDIRNTLEGGRIVEPAEFEGVPQSWRYRVETRQDSAVISFNSTTSVVVVTFWKKGRK